MSLSEPPSNDLVQRLRQLAELYEAGNLTPDEYQKAKSKLLDDQSASLDEMSLTKLLTQSDFENIEVKQENAYEEDVDIDPQDRVERVFEFVFRTKSEKFISNTEDTHKLAARYRRHRFINSIGTALIVGLGLLFGATSLVYFLPSTYLYTPGLGLIGAVIALLCFGAAIPTVRGYFRSNYKLKVAREIEGLDPLKGLARRIAYLGIFAPFLCIITVIFSFLVGQSNQQSIQATNQAQGTSIAIARSTNTANAIATVTAAQWTATPTFTATTTPSPTSTLTPSKTPTPTPTPTATHTPTETNTPTQTLTPTYTLTATNTSTPTSTFTSTPTQTSTFTLTPTPTFTLSPTPVNASVNGNNINARNCPSQTCDVIATISFNENLVVLGSYEDWYWVQLSDGKTAYVFSDLVELPEEAIVAIAPTITPSNTPSPTLRPSRTPQATAMSDVDRINSGSDEGSQLESIFASNSFVVSIGFVSVIPLRDNPNQYLVYAEIRVRPGERNTSNATLLRVQVENLLGTASGSDFSVIMNDGNGSTDYMWDGFNREWRVTPLS